MNSTPLAPLSRAQRWLLWCVFLLILLGTPFTFSWLFTWQPYVPVPKYMDNRRFLLLLVGGAAMSGVGCGFVVSRLTSQNLRDFVLNGFAFGTTLAIVEGVLMLAMLPMH